MDGGKEYLIIRDKDGQQPERAVVSDLSWPVVFLRERERERGVREG